MTTYQDWALARTCPACQQDHVSPCEDVAWDPDEARIVGCLCGCVKDGPRELLAEGRVGRPATAPHFLAEHPHCTIALHNEYGVEQPIEGQR